ncbi:MAG: Fe-S cluster assembly protein SufB [Gemmatimonadetes bacterium]|nr:Fe-S cluster assembly protein SufB [Gemmatimonadota bacterium]NIR81063.1 Fe-S cluster assembly protein SufB [Gemmatimonadota bacterium]NIT89881.1 Fe-S cluster assembly protein SufB [Gemmatimonadota bacterium]NIU33680.1 Fe-S cluster assembly protein SufB [Gemmatimonadota bacterium]NIU37923.1 Fe-S cluster assembly protein SufB [Gemmatimonadota bacterium]
MPQNETIQSLNLDDYKYDFVDEVKPVFRTRPGLDEEIVRQISEQKDEPEWMLEFRLKALEIYQSKPMPKWGADLSGLEDTLDEIYFYVRPQDRMEHSWDDVPEDIKNTFERLGIPEAERKILAGVGAQYESEMVYHSLKEEWEEKGVIFDSIEDGLKNHPELFREYFSTVIPPNDNKFAALNSAVWSGGSFVYIPKGVELETPLQAYFRVNQERMGQFERTLIIAERGSKAHYIEGCTAPVYSTESFHSGVIEIVVKPGAHFRYTTIQNWSNNMYNLVTQRALVHEDATMEWLDGNLGSKLTMKYPSCYLVGEGAHGEILSIAYSGDGQHQDTGGKVIHAAPHTTSSIVSKSISKGTGRSTYRGLCKVYEGATTARSNVECDALLIDETSRTDTYPYIEIEENEANVGHEATVSKVGDEQLFYLMSRGMDEEEAMAMIVRGFIEPIAKELPLEYAVELNRLIELEMEGSVG